MVCTHDRTSGNERVCTIAMRDGWKTRKLIKRQTKDCACATGKKVRFNNESEFHYYEISFFTISSILRLIVQSNFVFFRWTALGWHNSGNINQIWQYLRVFERWCIIEQLKEKSCYICVFGQKLLRLENTSEIKEENWYILKFCHETKFQKNL